MRLYGLRTGEPDPALMGTVGTVAGVLLDEDGHLVASHVAVSVDDLFDDLRGRAKAYADAVGAVWLNGGDVPTFGDAVTYTWLDNYREGAPRPCPGCHRCRADWPVPLPEVEPFAEAPIVEPVGRVDVGVTPVDAPRVDLGQIAYEAWCEARTESRADLGLYGSGSVAWAHVPEWERGCWRAVAAQVYALALADSRLVDDHRASRG